jgi:hypothetical protein
VSSSVEARGNKSPALELSSKPNTPKSMFRHRVKSKNLEARVRSLIFGDLGRRKIVHATCLRLLSSQAQICEGLRNDGNEKKKSSKKMSYESSSGDELHFDYDDELNPAKFNTTT